ncbi:DegQ family serine endoprotease [Siccirubricoccus sp. KC 17139]|uniref:DegQ family serine endoprotease n=1 Tax=Siccirubricoccus soli TaxID=2899147 RepID=A0ABT1DCS3_9PROT|nr:DegQ family serine endoprotease [Siccirubricoccus soli]MCO6419735.1 DegQ family serine endoprotease [Siccirubricoccus soli]MCP2685870.1 DegQ family serine endoprotease [Siccirubricoccus soli]
MLLKSSRLAAAGALALALSTTALVPLVPSSQALAQSAPATALALPRPVGPDFADLAARVAPSVVRISITGHTEGPTPAELPPELRGTPFERFFRQFPQGGQPRRIVGQGSGFIIDPAGYIATNNHVVGEADTVKVELADGRELPARVVGTDPKTDLALIKVEAGSPLPAVSFGDSDKLRVGEWVLAMGNPFGLGGSVTAGIVSARGRQIGAGPYDDFIQTDASINPGNSGGPLFNAAGEVVGVNSAIYSPSGGNVGIGFAVPSALAQNVIAQLKEHGRVERGWLGVSLQRLDPQLAEAMNLRDARGTLVAAVEPDSPAAKAGVQPGDVITGVNGRIAALPRDLAEAVAELRPGSTATLAVLRNGEARELRVDIGQVPDAREARARERGENGQASLGLALAPARDGQGVVVAAVRPDSIAANQGLQPGDVILRAGDRQVRAPRDLQEAVSAARRDNRPAIALQIEREGGRAFVALPLKG